MSAEPARYDGQSAQELAVRLGLPEVHLLAEVTSTLDVAHALGARGAPAGTLVLADMQTAGRGRQGRAWVSAPGAGIWLTLLERPGDAAAAGVLSLRLGLHAARTLDAFAGAMIQLKWPNDLYLGGRKLAGTLVEARWRAGAPDWIAVGFGVNVQAPTGVVGAGLVPGTRRVDVLDVLVPALRQAAARHGALTADELSAYAGRDLAAGRQCREPVRGSVVGLDASGALLVDTADGRKAVSAGSLVLQEDS